MALPTSYTDVTLSAFMASVLGPTAVALGWAAGDDDAGSFAEPINDTLIALGASDVSAVSDIEQLRAVARWIAWRWAADALASKFTTIIGGQVLTRAQLHDQAKEQRDYYQAQALPYLPSFGVTATPIAHVDDPVDAPVRYGAVRGW